MKEPVKLSVNFSTVIIQVSKLGFGCMGLTGVYNAPVSEDEGIAIIKYAFSKGITFLDTADMYGPHSCEVLLGKVCVFTLWMHNNKSK